MTTQELLKRVRTIEIKTKRLSSNVFSGEYHSTFKGRGMSFSEVRAYQYGDDVKTIDWNVTARFNEPFIKVFEEERELTLMLMVDVSGSTNFGSKRRFKRDLITELCAVLAFSANSNNDKIGLILFSSDIELYISPKKGRSHILHIIRSLLDFEPKNKGTNVAEALKFFNSIQKRACIGFVISDFLSKDYETPLRVASRKHDLTAIRVYDQSEEHLPDVGLMQALLPESGKTQWIDTSSNKLRAQYHQQFQSAKQQFNLYCKTAGVGKIELATHDSYVNALRNYFSKRLHQK